MLSLLLLWSCQRAPPAPDGGDRDGSPSTGDTGGAGATGDTGLAPITATVAVSGNPDLVLERRFAITVSRPASVTLRCTSPDDPLEDHLLTGPADAVAFELRLYGLLAETTYDCVLSGPSGAPAWSGSFRTEALPELMPSFVVTGDRDRATIDDDYLLFSHWKEGGTYPKIRRLVAADGDGRIRWYLTFPDARTGGIAADWNGTDLVVGGGGVPPSIRNLSGEVSFQVAPAVTAFGYHHEARRTPDGDLLSLQVLTDEEGGVAWQGFRVEVTEPATGDVIWQLDSVPLRQAGLLPSGSADDIDPYHANAVSIVDDGVNPRRVWISLKGLSTLMEVDWDSREVVSMIGPGRRIPLTDDAGEPLSYLAWFYGQHAPEHTPGEVLVYDNGGSRPFGSGQSRVARFALAGDHVELLWDWTEPDWFEPNFGAVHALEGGHVFVATGHCYDCPGTGAEADHGWMLEVDPTDDAVVWRLDFASYTDSLYRGMPIGGCELFANRRFCPEASR